MWKEHGRMPSAAMAKQIKVEVIRPMFRNQRELPYKVVVYEEAADGHRIYYQSRSFEGRDAAEAYKKEMECRFLPISAGSGGFYGEDAAKEGC